MVYAKKITGPTKKINQKDLGICILADFLDFMSDALETGGKSIPIPVLGDLLDGVIQILGDSFDIIFGIVMVLFFLGLRVEGKDKFLLGLVGVLEPVCDEAIFPGFTFIYLFVVFNGPRRFNKLLKR